MDRLMEKQIRATIYCSVSTKEQAEPLQKELIQTEKELSMLAERKKRLFELYEDGHIARGVPGTERYIENTDTKIGGR